jgi:AcrB/AcrD/AcrF family
LAVFELLTKAMVTVKRMTIKSSQSTVWSVKSTCINNTKLTAVIPSIKNAIEIAAFLDIRNSAIGSAIVWRSISGARVCYSNTITFWCCGFGSDCSLDLFCSEFDQRHHYDFAKSTTGSNWWGDFGGYERWHYFDSLDGGVHYPVWGGYPEWATASRKLLSTIGGRHALKETIVEGSMEQLVAILLTALFSALGIVQIVIGSGAGKEILQPLAIVVLGGLFTSTALTLLVLPALYTQFGWWLVKQPKMVSTVLIQLIALKWSDWCSYSGSGSNAVQVIVA